MEMLTFYVETIYFGMGSDIYQQEEGIGMSSSLSPVLANIYTEYFEEMALGSTSLRPSMWLRYVDDTFILWPNQEDVQILLNHVNSIRPSIQFTLEKEQDNKLRFLDILVTHADPWPFGWAVWHSCRMGDRNQEQTRGRIGPQVRLGNLRVGELLFRPLV